MKWLVIIAAVLAALLVWGWLAYPSYHYAFRLIIDVDTPSGLKTGSSVFSLTWRSQMLVGPRSAVTEVKGEAVFVDLGDGRHVIATLGFGPNGIQDRIDHLAFDAFRQAGRTMDVKTLAKAQGSAPLTGDLIPMLVTFSNPSDPKTARMVRPEEFPTVFGAGVTFRGARIEMTSDPVTKGIEKKLPWIIGFKGYSGGQLHPDWSRPEKNLTGNLFVKGAS